MRRRAKRKPAPGFVRGRVCRFWATGSREPGQVRKEAGRAERNRRLRDEKSLPEKHRVAVRRGDAVGATVVDLDLADLPDRPAAARDGAWHDCVRGRVDGTG